LTFGPRKTAHGFPPRINSAESAPQDHLRKKKSLKEKRVFASFYVDAKVKCTAKIHVLEENCFYPYMPQRKKALGMHFSLFSFMPQEKILLSMFFDFFLYMPQKKNAQNMHFFLFLFMPQKKNDFGMFFHSCPKEKSALSMYFSLFLFMP
jgi:hypothetical protein